MKVMHSILDSFAQMYALIGQNTLPPPIIHMTHAHTHLCILFVFGKAAPKEDVWMRD